MLWAQMKRKIDWKVIWARVNMACGLFVTGGALIGLVPAKYAGVVAMIALAIQSTLRQIQDPSGIVRPVEGQK